MLRLILLLSLLGLSACQADVASIPDASMMTVPDADPIPDGRVPPPGDATTPPADAMIPSAGPDGAGPHMTRSREEMVESDRRRIPVTVHEPLGVDSPPALVLLPGFLLQRSYYRSLAARIASHGFVVLQADPPTSLTMSNHVRMRDDAIAVINWAQESGTVAREARIAIGGHSLGGKVSAMVTASDVRVQALFMIDPVNGSNPFTGYSETLPDIVPAPVNTISVPVGILGETTNASGGTAGMACAPRDQNFQTFFEAMTAAPWVAEWDFEGADHMDFLSDPEGCMFLCSQCPSGSASPEQVVAGTMTLAVAFLKQHLQGEDMSAYLTGASLPSGVSVRSR